MGEEHLREIRKKKKYPVRPCLTFSLADLNWSVVFIRLMLFGKTCGQIGIVTSGALPPVSAALPPPPQDLEPDDHALKLPVLCFSPKNTKT